MNLQEYEGYRGAFTRDEYPGAYPNGSRIWKSVSEDGDAHRIGSMGTVLGSAGSPEVGMGYFVEWDETPAVAVFVMALKIKLA